MLLFIALGVSLESAGSHAVGWQSGRMGFLVQFSAICSDQSVHLWFAVGLSLLFELGEHENAVAGAAMLPFLCVCLTKGKVLQVLGTHTSVNSRAARCSFWWWWGSFVPALSVLWRWTT